jgi:exopolysaccharide biosynthesis polyprenyl glycosylphosphotransferase
LNRSARFAEHAVIFGGGALAGLLVDEIRRRPELGVRIDGFVGQGLQFPGMPCVDRQDLAEFIRTKGIRRVLVTMADRRGKLPVDSLLELKAGGIQIQDGSEYYEGITGKIDLDSLRLSWLLFSPGFHVRAPLRFYKRVFSVVLASLALVLLAPLMAVIAIAIRLDSKGPAIFRQARVGENGKIFMMYKFRSMRDGSEKAQLRPAGAEDQRITRLGKWLRPPRLDELPQLINIVKGDMAFVGPRPFVPEQEEEYTTAIPFYRQRWLVKPGATGWAQINRGYNVTLEDNREKLSYDLFYIKNISVGLDLYILLATAKILLLGRGGR